MSSSRPSLYRLAPKAVDDLDDIWRYSAEKWSLAQADSYIDELTRTFETIGSLPMMARERPEFDPPVRIHTHEIHLIVYVVTSQGVAVLRVLGGHQNWQALLRAIET